MSVPVAPDGQSAAVSPSLRQRLTAGVQMIFTGRVPTWLSPGLPVAPSAQAAEGRRWPFFGQYNVFGQPKKQEGVNFAQLRNLADFDLVRLAIETRKDQMCALDWSIQPRRPERSSHRPPRDDQARDIQRWFERPNRGAGLAGLWDVWLRELLEDHFVLDATSIFVRRSRSGGFYALEPIDGSTISCLIDSHGRPPMWPAPSHQQWLNGMPAANYTAPTPYGEQRPEGIGELYYAVKNRRTHRVYGLGVVEQIASYTEMAIANAKAQAAHFSDGNIPEGAMTLPADWTVKQIEDFQTGFNAALQGNLKARSKIKFVPAGTNMIWMKEPNLKGEFDEWLARVICYAFSLPNQPFIKQVNRATAENAKQEALSQGLEPTLRWTKRLFDQMLGDGWGRDDLEWVWENTSDQTTEERESQVLQRYQMGIIGLDEVRVELGLGAAPPELRGGQAPQPQQQELAEEDQEVVRQLIELGPQGVQRLVDSGQMPAEIIEQLVEAGHLPQEVLGGGQKALPAPQAQASA